VFFMVRNQQRRAWIFANGEVGDLQAVGRRIHAEDLCIAADGGLRHFFALGLQPALLVGDLDSVQPGAVEALQARGVRIEKHPVHKDETDLELAVGAALRENCTQIFIAGALGGRLDMTLGNIFLLMLPELQVVDARLEDGLDEVFLVRPGAAGVVDGWPGERVSLLPLGGPAHNVRTEGLFYPLRGETLHPERTRGISNALTADRAVVTLEAGLLICIHTRAAEAGGTVAGGEPA
jgi:thiamine pyrophosphokinase